MDSRSAFASRRLVPAAALVCALLLAGCRAEPKFRLGALPFPGVPGLYILANTEELGEHRYRSLLPAFDKERERGIVYTTRAGFIDISHIRDTADWTRFAYERIRPALLNGERRVSFVGSDRTRVYLRFNYPREWRHASEATRLELADQLALVLAQRTAYALATWHETITWYGYGVVPLVPERHSAFTYDDVVAHMVGLQVAADVLREGGDYNAAMTEAIARRLQELGAATPEQTDEAVHAVEGWWWRGRTALKRHVDSAFADGEMRPMLLPAELVPAGLNPPGDGGEVFAMPTLPEEQAGIRLSGFYRLYFRPGAAQWHTLRRRLDGSPWRLYPERDLPVLLEIIRQEMRDEFGPEVDVVGSPP